MSAAHAPDGEAAALIAEADEGTVEAHVPCAAGIAGVGSCRPVDGQLHVRERMTIRELGIGKSH